MVDNSKIKTVDYIMKQPLTGLRMKLIDKFQNPNEKFDYSAFQEYVKELQASSFVSNVNGSEQEGKFIKELSKVKKAIKTGKTDGEPDLNNPKNQMLWSAALVHLEKNKDIVQGWDKGNKAPTLYKTKLWKDLTSTDRAKYEMGNYALHISESIRNPDVKASWGGPNTWFYYEPDRNRIKIGFLNAMMNGFEHTRAVALHEISHSELTVDFTPKMKKSWVRMDEINKKELPPVIKEYMKARKNKDKDAISKHRLEWRAKFKEYMMEKKTWDLMHRLQNAAEDCCVNQNVVQLSKNLPQDHSVSLNHMNLIIAGAGRAGKRLEDDLFNGSSNIKADDAKKFNNATWAVNEIFFMNNGISTRDKEGWRKVGVDSEIIEAYTPNIPEGKAFEHLQEVIGGPNGVQNLLPKKKDKIFGEKHYKKKVDEFCLKRNEIIDQVWDDYLAPLADVLLKQYEADIEKQLDETEKKQDEKEKQQENQNDQNNEGDQNGDGQNGDGQQQDGNMNGDDENDGGDFMPPPPPPENPNEQRNGDNQDSQDKDEGLEEEKEGDSGSGDSSDEKDEDENKDSKGSGSSNEDEKEQDKDDEDGDGGSSDEKDDEKVDEKESDKSSASDDKSDDKKDQASSDDDGDGDGEDKASKEDEGQSLDDLIKEMMKIKDKMDEQQQQQSGDQNSQGSDDKSSKMDPENAGSNLGLEGLAKGDYSDYNARIAELARPIKMVERKFKLIKEQSRRKKEIQDRKNQLLPEGGDLTRFDKDAHKRFLIKKATGQKYDEKDMSRFNKDKQIFEEADIDVVMLIDGSGSMGWGLEGGDWSSGKNEVNRMDAAMQASVIMYEACNKVGINTYLGLWGDMNPPIIAQPGDNKLEIGERMEAARQGLNSATYLAPGIVRGVETVLENKEDKKNTHAGFTHVIVVSDGEIQDAGPSEEAINALLKNNPRATVDFVILGKSAEDGSDMEKVANEIKPRRAEQKVQVVKDSNPETIALNVANCIAKKMRNSQNKMAVSNKEKKTALAKALKEMQRG